MFVDFHEEGIELRIGKPIAIAGRGVVPSLLSRGASLFALLTPAEARIVARALLAAAERGISN